MASLVDTSKGEIAILASRAILEPINKEWRISSRLELLAVRVLHCEGNGLPTKPVADVVGVTVDQSDTHRAGEDIFQVLDEVGPDKIAGLLEGKVDLAVRLGVV